MAQTPQQRRANQKFAKAEEFKRGKLEVPVKRAGVERSPISTGWIVVLGFILCSGVIFEALRLFGII